MATNTPTATQVADRIIGSNWWPTDAVQITKAQATAQLAINAGMAHFAKLTRWEPFISNGVTNEVRYFNKVDDKGRIRLGDGLLACSSVKILGTTYTLNQNVYLEPVNAPNKNRPYTYLQMWTAHSYHHPTWVYASELRPRAIEVTGEWGYAREWPADAVEAIVGWAAGITLASVNQESELSSITEGSYSEAYDLVGPVDQKRALEEWGKHFKAVVALYSKPKPGPMSFNVGAHSAPVMTNYLPRI